MSHAQRSEGRGFSLCAGHLLMTQKTLQSPVEHVCLVLSKLVRAMVRVNLLKGPVATDRWPSSASKPPRGADRSPATATWATAQSPLSDPDPCCTPVACRRGGFSEEEPGLFQGFLNVSSMLALWLSKRHLLSLCLSSPRREDKICTLYNSEKDFLVKGYLSLKP